MTPDAAPPAPPPPPNDLLHVMLACSAVGAGILGFGVLLAIAGGVFLAVDGAVGRDDFEAELVAWTETLPIVCVSLVATQSLFGGTALVASRLEGRGIVARLRLLRDRARALPTMLGAFGVLACSAAASAVADLAGFYEGSVLERLDRSLRETTTGWFVAFAILATVAAPLCEELFFRGYLQPKLVRRLGAAAGIGVTALLFGLAHLDPLHSTLTTALGLGFGWVAHRTGSIVPSVAAHAVNNAVSVGFSRFAPPELIAGEVSLVYLAVAAPLGALLLLAFARATRA